MENPVVLITNSEEEQEEGRGGGQGNGSKEKGRASEGRIRSKSDEYREIADLSGFENLKSMILAEALMRRKKRNRKMKKRKAIESSYREVADLAGYENLKAMLDAEASMRRKSRNRKKKKRKTEFSSQEDVTVNIVLEKEQLGKDETLNIVEKEEGNGSQKKRRGNEGREKYKIDEYQKSSDSSDSEKIKAMIEEEAFLRRERRNRKKMEGRIESCAQEDVNVDVEEGIGQLSEDEALTMVKKSKLESVNISEMTEPQNLVTDAAKKTFQTTKAIGGADGVNSVEVIDICSSPLKEDESISEVGLGTGKAMNSVGFEVIDLFSLLPENDGSISDVSLGRSVEDTVKTVLTTKATGADDGVNSGQVFDLFPSSSEDDKSNSGENLGTNVGETEPIEPVVKEKKGKGRRKWINVMNATTTIDNVKEDHDVKNNTVLRMLLRKPRYFDPPDWKLETCLNCGKENHMAANCKAQKWSKPCFLCGSSKHIWKYCRKVWL